MKGLIHSSLSKLDVPSGVLQVSVAAPVFSTINRLLGKRVLNSTPENTGWERLIWRTGSGLPLIFTDWRACLKSISSIVKRQVQNAISGQKTDQMHDL